MSEQREQHIKLIQKNIEDHQIERAKKGLADLYLSHDLDRDYYCYSAVIAIMENAFSEAQVLLAKGVELYPKDLDLRFNLAFVYEQIEDWVRAKKEYTNGLYCNCTFDDTVMLLSKIKAMSNLISSTVQNNLNTNQDESSSVETIFTEHINPKVSGDTLSEARSNVFSAFSQDTDPLISIYVVGYNKLELHTKHCLDYLLEYTRDIDFELILVDNGSSDGTLEFFKGIVYPNKKIIHVTKNVGALYGASLAVKKARGRYIVGISNDIYVTENWLVNLLHCMFSDPRIGMAVPTTDNVSNMQDSGITFSSFDEMQQKAKAFNVSDSKKWHERQRIIPPMYVFNKTCMDIIGITDYGFLHDFSDDDISFRVWNAGYKVILCKDTFVCHAGKIEWKNQDEFANSLEQGRTDFKTKYRGIDAWDDVNNYEQVMISQIEASQGLEYAVLGIDVRCGTPVLEAKNKLIETGARKVWIDAYTREPKYWQYLNAHTTSSPGCGEIERLQEFILFKKYDYIIIGEYINQYLHYGDLFKVLLSALNPGGSLLFKVKNYKDVYGFLSYFTTSRHHVSSVVPVVDFGHLRELIQSSGFDIASMASVIYPETVGREDEIMAIVGRLNPTKENAKIMFDQMVTDYYVFKLTPKRSEQ